MHFTGNKEPGSVKNHDRLRSKKVWHKSTPYRSSITRVSLLGQSQSRYVCNLPKSRYLIPFKGRLDECTFVFTGLCLDFVGNWNQKFNSKIGHDFPNNHILSRYDANEDFRVNVWVYLLMKDLHARLLTLLAPLSSFLFFFCQRWLLVEWKRKDYWLLWRAQSISTSSSS